MPTDTFLGVQPQGLMAPARSAAAISFHDTNEISVPRALYVGTGGTLVVRLMDDTANVTLKSIASGSILDIRPKLVLSTGSNAADVVGLY
jgi:hypothetical protein